MNKSKNGNKEAKKPKQARVPNPPALPANLVALASSITRPKKK